MRQVSNADFVAEVLKADGPVLVDFWAPWCGPCKAMGQILDQNASILEEKIKICKVNIDDAGELASEYGIMSIPTLVIFSNGEVSASHTGSLSADGLEKFINDNI